MVTGGSHDNSLYLDSTEIFNWEWPYNAKWVNAKKLPAPRSDFSAATLDNVVFAFGKYGEIYPQAVLSLVQLLHYCALIGRELHIELWDTVKGFWCLELCLNGIRELAWTSLTPIFHNILWFSFLRRRERYFVSRDDCSAAEEEGSKMNKIFISLSCLWWGAVGHKNWGKMGNIEVKGWIHCLIFTNSLKKKSINLEKFGKIMVK